MSLPSFRRYISAQASPQKSGFWRTCGTSSIRTVLQVWAGSQSRPQPPVPGKAASTIDKLSVMARIFTISAKGFCCTVVLFSQTRGLGSSLAVPGITAIEARGDFDQMRRWFSGVGDFFEEF